MPRERATVPAMKHPWARILSIPSFVLAALLGLAACGVLGGDGGPAVTITSPVPGSTVTSRTVQIEGFAESDAGIASVVMSLDGGAYVVACTVSGSNFVCPEFVIAAGRTEVLVRAADGRGRESEVTVSYDYAGGPADGFEIELVFIDDGAFSPTQREAFQIAADRWSAIVVGDLEDRYVTTRPNECLQNEPGIAGTIDDLLIFVGSFTQDVGNVIGFAGPCFSRPDGPDAGTNLLGYMAFDTEDIDVLEADDQLVATVVHEMGHVLGIGTNWEYPPFYDLLDYTLSPPDTDVPGCSYVGDIAPGYDYSHVTFTSGPTFTGPAATDVYEEWTGTPEVGVPVEDGGGPGTQCGHWDESEFGNELMTGYLNQGHNPLSELTVMSLQDLGLTVDPAAAEAFDPGGILPSAEVEGTRLDEILIRPRPLPPHAY